MANEKRLICANDVLTGIATFKECYNGAGMKPWIVEHIQTALQMVERFVKETPTVEAVEVVHGRWIEDRWTKWQCDKCHSPSPAYGYPRMEYVKTRYCPNCGAKMC